MRLAFASDHAGLTLKEELVALARAIGHEATDLGPQDKTSVDYPDFAARVTGALARGEADLGVLIYAGPALA